MICSKCSSLMTWDQGDKAMVCFTCGNRAYSNIATVANPLANPPEKPKSMPIMIAKPIAQSNHQDVQKAISSLAKQALDTWQRLYKEAMKDATPGDRASDAYCELMVDQASPRELSKLITMWAQVIHQHPYSEYQAGAFCAISAIKSYIDQIYESDPDRKKTS